MAENLPPPKARFSICLLENVAHELLFLKRSPSSSMGPGQWGFPAGHIEEHESPMNCARREIDEEIGIGHLLELRQVHAPVRDSFYGGHYEIHLFHFIWREGTIVLNEEHTDFRWIGKHQLAALDTMLGIDEDIYYLDIWPLQYLNAERFPK